MGSGSSQLGTAGKGIMAVTSGGKGAEPALDIMTSFQLHLTKRRGK